MRGRRSCNVYKITYHKYGHKEEVIEEVFSYKKAVITRYLNILDNDYKPFEPNDCVCELKVLKNDKDYTQAINKFLMD
jgi:hypothetical protein